MQALDYILPAILLIGLMILLMRFFSSSTRSGSQSHGSIAGKFRRTRFDKESHRFISESDIFLSNSNGCAVQFLSKDLVNLSADLRYSIEITQDEKTNYSRLEAYSKAVVTQEIQKLARGKSSDEILGQTKVFMDTLSKRCQITLLGKKIKLERIFILGAIHILEPTKSLINEV